MLARYRRRLHFSSIIGLVALLAVLAVAPATRAAETVTVGDLVFVNKALVGVGRLPADLRDKFGETFGSGSGMAVDPTSWTRTPAGYHGTFYMLPDRGYNVSGTIDYRARINKLAITFKPLDDPQAVPPAQRQQSVTATLIDSILLTDPAGEPLTGLDADGIRLAANGLPTCRRRRTAASASTPNRWCCCRTAGFSSATNMVPTSTASRQRVGCWPRSGRRRRSSPNATARIISPPTIPVPARNRRSRAIRKAAARTTRASRG